MTENLNNIANGLKPTSVRDVLTKRVENPNGRPIMLWGAPGVGKSNIVAAVADDVDLPLYDVRTTLLDAVDLRGLPSIEEGLTVWNPPTFLPRGPGILFLDEISDAAPMVKAALYSLILDRRIGEYKLPDAVRIIAAGNRLSDRSSASRMPKALDNRFTHVEFLVDLDDWCLWAINRGIRTELIRFIRFRSNLLHSFDPRSDSHAFPSPRTWEYVNDILEEGHSAEAEYALIAGTVGEGAAAEFTGFLKVWRRLPSPDGILLNPDTEPVPGREDLDVVYALSGSLINVATRDNFDAIVTYAERLPEEPRVFLIRDAVKTKPELKETRAFIEWGTRNNALLS